jgi:hypothetical protein
MNIKIRGADAVIEYATSELLEHDGDEAGVSIRLFGQVGTRGETAVRLPREPKLVTVDGVVDGALQQRWDADGRRLTVTYGHPGGEVDLRIDW